MSVTPNIPEKQFFRVTEVCQLTDTQPYVLRFWESEFPQLTPDHGSGGKPVYKKDDVELIFQIKRLLYDEDYTIAAARQVLSGDMRPARPAAAKAPEVQERIEEPEVKQPRQLELDSVVAERPTRVESMPSASDSSGVSKERYDDAVEEITHLRLHLTEAETLLRRADTERGKALDEAERLRDKRDRAIGRLEAILKQVRPEAS